MFTNKIPIKRIRINQIIAHKKKHTINKKSSLAYADSANILLVKRHFRHLIYDHKDSNSFQHKQQKKNEP